MVCTAYVRWRGMSAGYTTDERQIVRQLPVSEQAVVHALKAFTDGEIQDCPRSSEPALIQEAFASDHLGSERAGEKTSGQDAANPRGPQFINPEDIEFGAE